VIVLGIAGVAPRLLTNGTPVNRAVENPTSPEALTPTKSWRVVKVADGDTITVVRGSLKEKIRFCGIDAPESKQPLGKESKVNLQRLINGANGEVQLSIIESDRYGRQVAEVFAGEKFLQEEQLKAGLAYHYAKYSGNCLHRDAIVEAEAIAQTNNAGVWGGNYEKPWDYRKS